MTTTYGRCQGAFFGHANASNFDPSILLAIQLSDSLLENKKFNGPDVLSRYLYLYQTQKCEIGEITKCIYQEALSYTKKQASIDRQSFVLEQSAIDEIVKLTDKKCNGHTAGCGPAQRSFALAFCPYISDDALYDFSVMEAKLTHYSPLAGEVSGIVNVICRSLLKNQSWYDAVQAAFQTPRLHEEVKTIAIRHNRWSTPVAPTHPSYAPTVLNAALHYVATASSYEQAIISAKTADKIYCLPIVGVLAGARWGVSEQTYMTNLNDTQIKSLVGTANTLIDKWDPKQLIAKT